MTYLKEYTAANVKLIGKGHNGRVYLFLLFNYSFKVGNTYKPLKVSTGEALDPVYWSDGDFTDAFRKKHREVYQKMVAKIEAQRQRIFNTYTDLVEQLGAKPDPEVLVNVMKGKVAQVARIGLSDYIRSYADSERCKSPLTKAKYRTLAEMLDVLTAARKVLPFRKYASGSGDIHLNTFSDNDWNDLSLLIQKAAVPLTETFRRYGVEGLIFTNGDPTITPFYAVNTLEKIQQNLKAIFNVALRERRTLNIDPNHLDKASKVSSKSEFLKADEIAKIIEARFPEAYLENARKLIVVELMIGCRVGDLGTVLEKKIHTIKGDNITFKGINLLTKKTGAVAVVPLFAPALAILESEDKPRMISGQKLNDYFKVIAERLGLDRIQHVIERKADGSTVEAEVPLYEVVSTHSCRRSLKTLLESYPLMASRQLVADMMGHVIDDKSADRGYFSLTPEMSAEALLQQLNLNAAKLPFQLLS